MAIDKRAARREFKERKTPKGIFVLRCTPTGEVWVSASRDLNASKTGTWFQLRNGLHINKPLQAAWNAHGAEAFEFEVLETFGDDLSPLTLNDSLRDRQKHWRAELKAAAI